MIFKIYCFLSILIVAVMLANYYLQYNQIFSCFLYFCSSFFNVLVLQNFIIILCISIVLFIFKLSFGNIREIEKISIIEKTQKKLPDLALFIILYVKNIFQVQTVIKITFLYIFIIYHQVLIKRTEYVKKKLKLFFICYYKKLITETVQVKKKHLKIAQIYIILFILDFIICYYLFHFRIQSQILKLIFLDILLTSLNLLFTFIKYIFHLYETYTYSHIEIKYNFLMVLEFLITLTKLILQIYAKLILHLYTLILTEFAENIVTLYQNICLFIKLIRILKLLNELPDVKQEDLINQDDICLICLQEIKQGKKIGCGHFFHKSCLKELIYAKSIQFCPKCRKEIKIQDYVKEIKQKKQQEGSNITQNINNEFSNQSKDNKLLNKIINQISSIQMQLTDLKKNTDFYIETSLNSPNFFDFKPSINQSFIIILYFIFYNFICLFIDNPLSYGLPLEVNYERNIQDIVNNKKLQILNIILSNYDIINILFQNQVISNNSLNQNSDYQFDDISQQKDKQQSTQNDHFISRNEWIEKLQKNIQQN
ncbi:hypothetical protein IMG5_098210 [Ichthyophthirius multifiliis]|uniref:RING-type domain-containing protein n=1 Tax=Ichthyophthirius multifiliis TaxID=5932 RepID=G0QRW5_ICHMU|nr:hypothetical protein IMG5_098210 [Ichthyophthirius multifiliis]EGR31995.1 hypothetical protein IMG5_098210 [Ichthyophthirius multifiliis]|eukprot:XP_004035481.1 hypothetical protein IMG5_098210 [Ichthyophthirius multifiliis]